VAETGKGNRSFGGILSSRNKLRVNFRHTRKDNILRSIWEKSPWSASSWIDLQAEASLGLLVSWIPRHLDTRKQQSLNFHSPPPSPPPLLSHPFPLPSSRHSLTFLCIFGPPSFKTSAQFTGFNYITSVTWHSPKSRHHMIILHPFSHVVSLIRQFFSTDWLRDGRSGIESRWGRDFLPVQTGPEAHPASCKMGIGSFRR